MALALAGLGMCGGGVSLVVQRETGTRARATITECQPADVGTHGSYECTGTWVAGGSLLKGGHVVRGAVEGAEPSDVGRSIEVTLSGDRAHTTSLTTAIILLALGLFVAIVAALMLRAGQVGRRPRQAHV